MCRQVDIVEIGEDFAGRRIVEGPRPEAHPRGFSNRKFLTDWRPMRRLEQAYMTPSIVWLAATARLMNMSLAPGFPPDHSPNE